eukprot:TRINITY_DN10347_c0_g1_i1.p1 TRINITY_DN10347_c0_g1~~TRINITY_DN10347_c0_g1_i1.p1  ORF type:complete len:171 (+),score=23.08 TRINITY_DN10347_c0_g1_i1:161-673(+)
MVTANGKWYHKNCFRCVQCLYMVDSLNNNDGPDGCLYCKMCYKEKYGPQNRPSDIDLKARNTGSLKSEDPSKNCPRCGGGVFANESVSSKGKSYHTKCATCKLCEGALTHNTLFDGDDSDIYCKFCYHRKIRASWVSRSWVCGLGRQRVHKCSQTFIPSFLSFLGSQVLF